MKLQNGRAEVSLSISPRSCRSSGFDFVYQQNLVLIESRSA
jgi:predicted Zn-ribbon and HTH transcriptional regulator